jgi:hypothetical protein
VNLAQTLTQLPLNLRKPRMFITEGWFHGLEH